jgi:hypothetical protein
MLRVIRERFNLPMIFAFVLAISAFEGGES